MVTKYSGRPPEKQPSSKLVPKSTQKKSMCNNHTIQREKGVYNIERVLAEKFSTLSMPVSIRECAIHFKTQIAYLQLLRYSAI